MPVVSLNHNINFGESPATGDVMSQGSSTSFDCAAHIKRTGTVNKK